MNIYQISNSNRYSSSIPQILPKKQNIITIEKTSNLIEKYRKNIENNNLFIMNRKDNEIKVEKFEKKVKLTHDTNFNFINTISKESTHPLTTQQQYVLDLVLNKRKNIFITGSAGKNNRLFV